MPRLVRFGKPYAVRFRKELEKDLITLCINNEINESEVIQQAVECFLKNSKCFARRRMNIK